MKWESFESHLLASQKELYFTKQFSDVTLVSDDLVEFLAHKTILATASPMLKTLLGMSSQQQSSFLYLKGIRQEDLEAILQYIYLGETEISEQNVQVFTSIARDLGIQEMGNSYVRQNYSKKLKVEKLDFLSTAKETTSKALFSSEYNQSEYFDNGVKANLGFLNDVTIEAKNVYEEMSTASDLEETPELLPTEKYQDETDLGILHAPEANNFELETSTTTSSLSEEVTDGSPVDPEDTIGSEDYNDEMSEELPLDQDETVTEDNQADNELTVKKRGRKRKPQPTKPRTKEEPADCEICNTHYTTKRSYRRHYMSAHELRLFNCDECDETYTNNDGLRVHKNRIHRNITIPCTKCDKIFKDKGDLRNHMMNRHGISCEFHKKKFISHEEFNKHIQEEHVKKYCA